MQSGSALYRDAVARTGFELPLACSLESELIERIMTGGLHDARRGDGAVRLYGHFHNAHGIERLIAQIIGNLRLRLLCQRKRRLGQGKDGLRCRLWLWLRLR